MEEEKKEEEKEGTKKSKKDAAKAEGKAVKGGDGESHVKGGKADGVKGEKKSKKDKEWFYRFKLTEKPIWPPYLVWDTIKFIIVVF